jgi:hypothetical protein
MVNYFGALLTSAVGPLMGRVLGEPLVFLTEKCWSSTGVIPDHLL